MVSENGNAEFIKQLLTLSALFQTQAHNSRIVVYLFASTERGYLPVLHQAYFAIAK